MIVGLSAAACVHSAAGLLNSYAGNLQADRGFAIKSTPVQAHVHDELIHNGVLASGQVTFLLWMPVGP